MVSLFLYNLTSQIYIIDVLNPHMITPDATTQTQIIHSSDGWSSEIKSLFIYWTGAVRYNLVRGGTPAQRGFVLASTVIAETFSTALINAINDPTYVENHVQSLTQMYKGNNNSTLELDVSKDLETLSNLGTKLLPDSNYILNYVINSFKGFIEPVSVNYSNEILANQIHGISVLLYFLSIAIMILLISLLINIIIFVYSDRLYSIFTNKYLIKLIILNKKLIGLEIVFLGGSLIYFMYILSYGLHFLVTHPISFS